MTVAVNTVNNLKAVDTSSGKKLRFLEAKRSWYWYDPDGAGTPDDENIILPNTNTGRWYKTEPKLTNNGLIYSSHNGTQTINAAANRGYIIRSTNGIVNVNLPSSPVVGDTVLVSHNSSGLSNVTRVNRNGNPIRTNTASNGIEIFLPYTETIFTYCDATVGWTYRSSQAVRVQATYTQTFTYSSGGDTNGFIFWLGRNEGVNSWVEPNQQNGAVGPKLTCINGAGSLVNNLISRSSAEISLSSTTGPLGWTIYIFTNLDNVTREFRLTKLTLQSSTSVDYAWRNFAVYGLARSNYPITPSVSNLSTMDAILVANAPWVELYRTSNNTSMSSTSGSSWGNYDVNDNNYYSAFRISATGPDSGGRTTNLFLNEIELYGEVRY